MTTFVSRLNQLRSQLELPVLRRAVGLYEGMHTSILKGQGMDFEDLHLYAPGDDVSDIDWKSTARAGIPIIKRFKRLSNASLILLVDTGRSMAALAPSGEPKHLIAEQALALVAYLGRERGDRIALLAGDESRIRVLPPRTGAFHAELVLRKAALPARPDGPHSDVAMLLTRAAGTFRRRGLAVLVTDEAHPAQIDESALRRLRERHELMVVAIADAAVSDPQFAGSEPLDVDTRDTLPEFVRARPAVHRRELALRAEQAASTTARLERYRVVQCRITSVADVLPALVRALARGQRGRL